MTNSLPTRKPQVLLDGYAFVESARWHDGRFWFAHWSVGEIVAVDAAGRPEVVAPGRAAMGWSFDWLPDGRMLITGETLLRREPDGRVVQHADLAPVAGHSWNEIAVSAGGNVYVNGADFDFLGGAAPKPGIIALAAADGSVRQVADGIEFPNGMLITPDDSTLIVAESFAGRLTAFDIEADGSLSHRRVWAEGVAPDGICMDAEGAIWTGAADIRMMTGRADLPGGAAVRVREGGEIVDRIEFDRPGFSLALGGPEGRTLYVVGSEWCGVEQIDAVLADRTGQVLSVEVDVAAAQRG